MNRYIDRHSSHFKLYLPNEMSPIKKGGKLLGIIINGIRKKPWDRWLIPEGDPHLKNTEPSPSGIQQQIERNFRWNFLVILWMEPAGGLG